MLVKRLMSYFKLFTYPKALGRSLLQKKQFYNIDPWTGGREPFRRRG